MIISCFALHIFLLLNTVNLSPPLLPTTHFSSAAHLFPLPEQFALLSGQPAHLETAGMTVNPMHSSLLNRQLVHLEPSTLSVGMGSQQLPLINKQLQLEEPSSEFCTTTPNSFRSQKSVLAQKQPTEMKFLPQSQGSMFLNLGSQPLPSKSKQMIQREPWPKIISVMPINMGSQQLSSTQRGTGVTGRLDQSPKIQKSTSGNAGLQKSLSSNKRVTQMEVSPKVSTESFQSVRSKMRESLAASLALVSEEQSMSKSEGKDLSSEDGNTTKKVEAGVRQGDPSSLTQSAPSSNMLECSSETLSLSENDSQKHAKSQNSTSAPYSIEKSSDNSHSREGDVVLGSAPLESLQNQAPLEDDDTQNGNFLLKDELLQGNGLCWASHLDVDQHEAKENHDSKRVKLSHVEPSTDVKGKGQDEPSTDKGSGGETPQTLAAKIEAELFRLFGGVNKKYKEKGRSLLFNLKDRSNPELRKQVLYGEIAPERLCSMAAEELASKELSEWRIAKAEELAQMIVLPDSDVDIRRLVKKTHKGEFQVEVERDYSASVEVTFGANSLSQYPTKGSTAEAQTRTRTKSKKKEAKLLSKCNDSSKISSALAENVYSGDQIPSNNLTALSHEKTDFMQDIIMDELKDEEVLQEVPSLDEFLKDLDSEPPFENITTDIAPEKTISDERTSGRSETKLDAAPNNSESKLDSTSDTMNSNPNPEGNMSALKAYHGMPKLLSTGDHTNASSKDPVDIAKGSSSEMDTGHVVSDNNNLKHAAVHLESDARCAADVGKGEHAWEGLIQLNIASLVTVLGFYKSGEQTSTEDWPNFLEIKGRVRLDAFEKFLQELPLSRSRAIMIVQFCWKEGSPDSGRLNLSETVDSYIANERVGYAEPAPGTEIYFCPPHPKTTQILVKNLSKEHEDILSSVENGFIGIVVWRRAHLTSTASPRPSSHLKRSSKKQLGSRKQQNSSTDIAYKSSMSYSHVDPKRPNSYPLAEKEPMDDAPPGFGPASTRDDDDLPEFDFTQDRTQIANRSRMPYHVQPPACPAEQMRQLIHKYGQSQTGKIRINSWNDDDDDDIPEWQPNQDTQACPQPPPPPPQMHGYQQPLHSHLTRQQLLPVQPQQQPTSNPSNAIPHQQLVHLAAPMPALLQPQMGLMQGPHSAHPGWQLPGQWWAPTQVLADVGFSVNEMVQPPNYGSLPPFGGQSYGMPNVGYPSDGQNR